MKKFFQNKPLIGLIVFSIIISIINPRFLSAANILNVLRQTSINAVIAAGMTFVILTGGIDLSVGSILAICGAVSATMFASGYGALLSIGLPIVLGIIFGAISGMLVSYGRLQAFITTLVTMTMLRGATLVFTDGKPISIGFEENTYIMDVIGSGSFMGIPLPIYIMIAVYALAYYILNHTRFGRYVYAVGGNEEATRLSGIDIDKVKIKVYSISGALSALAGIIVTARLSSAQPTAGSGYELDAIAAVVLGGTSLSGGSGRITGTITGALIIGVLSNALNLLNVSSYYQMMIKGLVILIAVLMDRKAKSTMPPKVKKAMQALGIIVAILSLVMGLVKSGVFEKNETSEVAREVAMKNKVGLVVSTLNNPFFVTLRDGAVDRASELGIEIIVLDSQNDPSKELSNIEDLIVRDVDVILVNPTDSEAVGTAVKAANRAGIPVITLDRGSEEGIVATHIASDNAAGGAMAGMYIIETLGEGAKVVELEGISGTTAARERGRGFNEAIGNKLEVVSRQSADFDRTKGLNVMENILQATPNIEAVFAHNDEMALGALKAIEGVGSDILVVGFDATKDAVKSVSDGKLGATIAQKPNLIGSTGIETAVKIIDGEKTPDYLPIQLELIK